MAKRTSPSPTEPKSSRTRPYPSDGATSEAGDANVLKIVQEYRREAEAGRQDRIYRNRKNWEMYFGQQDYSDKQDGQSTEFLPKTSGAVEQFTSFIQKAMTQFGSWFSCDVPKMSPLDSHQAAALMKVYLSTIRTGPNKEAEFPTLVTNSVKAGLLESLLIMKISGQKIEEITYKALESGKLSKTSRMVWRTRIDLIPSEDYYPDPTGRGLYEIHRVERDLVDVQAMADQGIYDKAVVDKITEDYSKEMDRDQRRALQRNQNEATPPGFRKRVVIDECWGTLIDPTTGKVLKQNGLCAIANDKYVIRKPEDNPHWHGRSPILAVPLIQVPFTVWGRALYDQAASLNQSLNELFNLMLDGGISSVWGVRQVRTDWLQDPRQVSGGIPAGATLAINENVPAEGKAVEVVATGKVPPEAMQMFAMADREFQAATLVNDIRLGNLPERATKATEIVEASANSNTMIDAFTAHLEREFLSEALEMIFLDLMQNADDLAADSVVEAIGVDAAFKLSRMSPAERFAIYAGQKKFKVDGISGTLSRARDFQKVMATMQAIATNPMLMQAFMRKYNPDKALDTIFKAINVDPADWMNSPEEQKQVDQRMQETIALQQAMGGGGGQNNRGSQPAPQSGGDAQMRSEVAQNANPTGGVPNGM